MSYADLTPRPPRQRAARWTDVLGAVALAAAVWLVFRPVLGHEFARYDEQEQLVENPLVRDLSFEGLGPMFTSRSLTSYYPFRTLSFALDYAAWGLDPTGFHLTNLVLHTANVVLLFWLIRRLQRPGRAAAGGTWAVASAALGAGLFALHPVVVEPVAWIGAREELLMVLAALACLHLHLSARRIETRQGGVTGGAVACHAGATAACIVACGSNVVGAVIPALVTAWDAMRLPPPRLKRIALGTAPLWAVGVATVVIKAFDPLSPKAEFVREALTLAQRALFVPSVFARNLWALLWPRGLALAYPWEVPEGVGSPWFLAGVGVAAGTVAAVVLLRRHRLVAVGLVWFLLALAPSGQIVPHHVHRADRFLYLPLVGLAVAAGAGLARLRGLAARWACGLAAIAVLGVWGVLAARQVPVWADSVALFGRVVEVNPANADMRYHLATAMAAQGDEAGAFEQYQAAVRLDPRHKLAQNNLGNALLERGRPREAIEHFRAALAADPQYAKGHFNLAHAYEQVGRPDRAEPHYEEAVAIDPDYAEAHLNLANLLVRTGRPEQAVSRYEAAMRARPDYFLAHYNLGIVLAGQGEFARAARHARRALEIDPESPEAMRELARVLATAPGPKVRDPATALALAERAAERVRYGRADALGVLAAAQAASGRVGDAVATARRAVEIAEAEGDVELAGALRLRLASYEEALP